MPDVDYHLALTKDYSSGYYGGTGSSSQVPGLYPIAINGRPYLVDETVGSDFATQGNKFRMESLDIIRQQADNSGIQGEATITPEGTWRRSEEDWSHGAGQTFRDHQSSDGQRFRSSKGMDVWTPFQLSALPDTDQKLTSANTNLAVLSAGNRLYVADGQTVKFTTDVTIGTPTFTGVTGLPAQTVQSLTTDGTTIYINMAGSNGIYTTTTTTTSASSYVTSVTSGPIAYVKGRLMAAHNNALYNIVAGGALPTALFTQANTSFRWVGFAEGPGQMYVAGYAGDRSLIYRTAVKTDGTALDAPIVAGELPTGEVVRSIYGYLGFIVIGSDLGVRFASPDNNGDLVIGSLIPTPAACYGFTAEDRFVWFGWSNYDGTSTGLGRLDFSVFTNPSTPAYASDLMTTGQGNVISLATFQQIQVFAVQSVGIFAATTTPSPTASIDSGLITYGIPDPKVAMYIDLNCEPLPPNSTIVAQFSPDSAEYHTVGTLGAPGSVATTFVCNQSRAHTYEVRIAFTATTQSPTLKRWTMRAYPAPSAGFQHIVPLYLHEQINLDGINVSYDVTAERDRFRDLANTRSLVAYQEGGTTHTVFVDSIRWLPHHRTVDKQNWDGLLVLTLKELPE